MELIEELYRVEEYITNQQRKYLIGYVRNSQSEHECLGYIIGQRLQKEFAKSETAIVKELVGPSLQLILEISKYSDVLLIDEVYAGQEAGEILLFDINDMCAHIGSLYINGMNLSEAINSGRELGIPIPDHFLLAGIEIGENSGIIDGEKRSTKGFSYFEGSLPIFLQIIYESIFETIRSIITDFINKSI